MKRNNNKGFTLAELLIVVAIIAVLVAIAIPVFTSQLEKSRESTDMANVRSAYAEVVTHYLDKASVITMSVKAQQTISDWQTSPTPVLTYQGDGKQDTFSFSAVKKGSSYTVTLDEDKDTGVVYPKVGGKTAKP